LANDKDPGEVKKAELLAQKPSVTLLLKRWRLSGTTQKFLAGQKTTLTMLTGPSKTMYFLCWIAAG
jgi:hypothetical protein